MGWIKRKLTNISIRKQIQIAIMGASLLVTLFLGIFAYQISSNAIEKNYREDFSYNLGVSGNIIEIQANSIIEQMRNLLTETYFMNTLRDANDTEGRYFSTYESRNFDNYASNICLQEAAVDEVLTVGLDGKLFWHSKLSGTSYSSYYREKNIVEEDWITKVKDASGREVFFGNNVLVPEEDDRDFSIVKYMIDPYTSEPVGYIIVNVRKDMLKNAFSSKGNYETNCFLVVDPECDYPLLYFMGKEEYREEVLSDYLALSSKKEKAEKSSYVFSTLEEKKTGWQLVSLISRGELSRDSSRIRLLIVLAMFVMAIGSLLLASVVSAQIYEPLSKLEKTIDQVGEGSRHITEEFDRSELGVLGSKFKRMVNHNLELRERLLVSKIKEREAELYLLQEQINPHFLYNTLDSLYCMAVIHDAEDIAKMVDALSNTFRLSLNDGDNFIKIEDELKHIENYMVVQNMRYNNRFQLKIQVEDSMLGIRIQKLLLEPFVENAMYHGLETKIGTGSINIHGWRKQEDLYFTVEDDGVGVEDIAVMEKGYGIKNVRERIRLYYGESYGVSFESQKDVGTKVTIHISVAGERYRNAEEELSDH